MKYKRIIVDPRQMGGIPCIRGLRVPVATVVEMVAEGMTEKKILKAYPDLEAEDIHEALRYAAEAVHERGLPLAASSPSFSVILFRHGAPRLPARQAHLLLANLPVASDALQSGAVVVFDGKRLRVRMLPIAE